MLFLVKWEDKEKIEIVNGISNTEINHMDEMCKNIGDCIEVFSMGASVRDAFEELIEWLSSLDNRGNQTLRNLHKAERLCRSFLFEFRTCLNYLETYISRNYGKNSELYQLFKQSTHKAYDTCPEYGFTYELRNCAQHCDKVVHGFCGHSGISSNSEKLLHIYIRWKDHEKDFINAHSPDIDLSNTFIRCFAAFNEAIIPVMRYLLIDTGKFRDVLLLREKGEFLAKQNACDISCFSIIEIDTDEPNRYMLEDMADKIQKIGMIDWDMICEMASGIETKED